MEKRSKIRDLFDSFQRKYSHTAVATSAFIQENWDEIKKIMDDK